MKTPQRRISGGTKAALAEETGLKHAVPQRMSTWRTSLSLAVMMTLLLPWMLRPANAVTVVSTYVTSNTTWTTAGDGVYEIASNITVVAGVTLTIQPGVTVRFRQNQGIWVDGTLNAVGNSGSRITFTGTTATKGWWRGVHIINAGSASISYADICYAGYWDAASLAKSGTGSLSLTQSTIRDSSDRGLVVSEGYSSFVSANNQFMNHNGRACHIGINASFDDTTSTFSNNAGPDVYLDGGTITTNTTWNLHPAYSFHLSGSITVGLGANLVVKPGTVVKVAQNQGIWVDGSLNAAGTSGARIHFTDWRDDTVGGDANKDGAGTAPGSGWWRIIKIQGAGAATFNWCTLSYAGYWDSVGLGKEGTGSLSVSNTTVKNGLGYGIHISNSSGVNSISNTTATGNVESGMYINNSAVTVAGSTFSNNGAYGLLHEVNDTIVYPDNIFTGNGLGSIGVNGGTIVKNITWTGGIDMVVRSNTTVGLGKTLTIQPGVTVKFAQNQGLWVEGALSAVGLSTKPIAFTGTTATKGWWRGMHAVNSGNIALDYTNFSYAGYWDAASLTKSGTGSLSLKNSIIRESSDRGLVVNPGYSSFVSANNRFMNNDGRACHIGINASFDDVTSTFANNAGADVYLDGGHISTNTTWNLNPAYSFYISGNITVGAGARLDIKPGTVVKFAQNQGMWVEGHLEAAGAAGALIHMTDWRDDTVGGDANKNGTATGPGAGWWRLIRVQASGSAKLDWCVLSYSGYWDSVGLWKEGDGDISVSNTTITRGSGYGCYVTNSTGVNTFTKVTATANGTSGMYVNNSTAIVSGSIFSDNGAYGLLHEINDTIFYPNNYFANNGAGSVGVNGGTISKNITWARGIDMEIRGNMTIVAGSTLTIQPGVTVKFAQNQGLWVDGSLNAVGEPDAPIAFTGSTPSKGWWRGVHVTNSGNATLTYAELSYAGYWEGATLTKSGSGFLSLTNSTIRDSSDRGLVVNEGYSSFKSAYNQFENITGKACHMGINVSFDDATSHFSNNAGPDVFVDGGSLTANTVWNVNPAYSLYLSGNITVMPGAVLSIRPGTVVKIAQNQGIWVEGSLNAKGLSGSQIHFTDWRDDTVGGDANKDGTDTSPGTGWWRIIHVYGSGQTTMEWCSLSYAGYWESVGLWKQGDGNMTLLNTTIRNVTGDGLLVDASTGVHILRRSMFLNNGNGVHVVNQTQPLSIAVSQFEGNTGHGVLNGSTGVTVDARSNWWGSASGPQHASNAEGTGDRVSDGVLFDPWRRVPSPATILSPVRAGTLVAGDTLRFTGAGEPGAKYEWNFGGGRTSSALNPGWMSFTNLGTAKVTFGTTTQGKLDPFPDERNFHVVTASGNIPDLRATQLMIPGSLDVGKTVTIRYEVSNVGNGPASGTWKDAVYLSDDEWLDGMDAELGSATVTKTLAAGGSYQGDISARIPVVEEGARFLIVSVDDAWQVLDRHRLNNEKSGSASVLIPALVAGTAVTGTLEGKYQADGHHFRMNLAEPGNLRLNVTGNVTVYVSTSGLAGPRNYTWQGSSLEDLLISGLPAGSVYIQVVNHANTQSSEYRILAKKADLAIARVNPPQCAAGEDLTLTVEGLGFRPGVKVDLVGSGSRIPAVPGSVHVFSNQRLTANFAGASLTQGTYQLEISGTGLVTAILPDAVTVEVAAQPRLALNLVVPDQLGYHGLGTLYVEYGNDGNAPMPAPFIVVTATQNERKGAIMTLDPALVSQGFWTSAMPAGFATSIQLLGSGAVAGMLMPGEHRSVPIYYTGWQLPWDFNYPKFNFQVSALHANDTRPVPWLSGASLAGQLRPYGMSDAAWPAVRDNLVEGFGTTVGSFVKRLGQNSAYLENLGERIDDVSKLVEFEVSKARGAFHPLRVLAAKSDLEIHVPGSLPFLFGRSYPHELGARLTSTTLGKGWCHTWDYQLETRADGMKLLRQPGGALRVFAPDQRGGFLSMPGDYAKLIAISGGHQLDEKDGSSLLFDTVGRLTRITDATGQTITFSYTNGRLTSLKHASGPSLTLTYLGERIISLADSYGRRVTYRYDDAGRLIEVRDPAGRSTMYTYDASANGAGSLMSAKDPAGVLKQYRYNAAHFVERGFKGPESSALEVVRFAVDGARATVTDALDRAFSVVYDHRGLMRAVTDPEGRQTILSYDRALNNTAVLDSQGFGLRFRHDRSGNTTEITDATGIRSLFTYENGKFLTGHSDGLGQTFLYKRDADGKLLGLQGPDGAGWKWTYNTNGRPALFENSSGSQQKYTWNQAGQLTAMHDKANQAIGTYQYDSVNRLTRLTKSGDTLQITYTAGDKVLRQTAADGSQLDFGYDAYGRRAYITSKNTGHRVNYQYDQAGRLSRLSDAKGVTIVQYAYDPTGRLLRKTFGNGSYTQYTTDAYGRVTRQSTHKSDNTILSAINATYDAAGNLARHTSGMGTWDMGYDIAGRLLKRSFTPPGAEKPSINETFRYNAAGQLNSRTRNGTTYTVSHDPWGRITDDGTYVYRYDADGNLVSRAGVGGTVKYVSDQDGRVISMSGVSGTTNITYDPVGALKTSSLAGDEKQRWQIDPTGAGPLAILDETGKAVASFYQGLGMAAKDTGEGRRFPEYDPVTGRQILELDSTGGKVGPAPSLTPPVGPSFEPVLVRKAALVSGGDWVGGPVNGFGMQPMFPYPGSELGLLIDAGHAIATSPEAAKARTACADLLRNETFNRVTGVIGTVTDADDLFTAVMRGGSMLHSGLNKLNIVVTDIPDFSGVGQFANGVSSKLNLLDKGLGVIGIAGGGVEVYDAVYGGSKVDYGKLSHGFGTSALAAAGLIAAGTWAAPVVAVAGVAAFISDNTIGLQERFWYWWDDLDPNPTSYVGKSVGSMDPNELIGPAGFGTANYLGLHSSFGYRIDFENDPEALAPAQVVTITHSVNDKLNRSSFRLTAIGFGDVVIPLEENDGNFLTTVDMVQDGLEMEVQIDASYNKATGRLLVRFTTIDKATGLPPTVDHGFLPAEDGTGCGKGYVSYVVSPLSTLKTGAEIRSVATINFDFSYDIKTNQVDPHDPSKGTDPNKEALVTIDVTAPVARVKALPVAVKSVFPVSWSGSDGTGSGIASYTVYVSEKGSTRWKRWLTDTTLKTAKFKGTAGKKYRFNVTAKDKAGNVQAFSATNATGYTLVQSQSMIVVKKSDGTVIPAGKGVIDFGETRVGATERKTLTIRNRGKLTLSGLGVSLAGKTPDSFKVEGLDVRSLAPGKSTTFTVIYQPKDVNPHTALLKIVSKDIYLPTYRINLKGTGLPPAKPEIAVLQGTGANSNLTDNRSTRNFGMIKVGTSSDEMVFRIKNVGTAPLKNLKVTLSGTQALDFKVVSLPSRSVSPGKSTQFRVIYKPSKAIISKALLKIASNDANENPFRVKVTGEGKK